MTDQLKWQSILVDAVNQPGLISSAYSQFHNYSMGNRIAATWQAWERNIDLGPINTYVGWSKLGRQVKKGSKAIALCMPVTLKIKDTDKEGKEIERVIPRFVWKNNWFLMSQTEGEAYTPEIVLQSWDKAKALKTLQITQVAFEELNGNVLGYALDNQIAINPINPLPLKTMFHELGHIVLGHTKEHAMMSDSEMTPRDIREVEAESVALICCESLGLPGSEFSRGYIQMWLKADVIPEKSCQKIFAAADKILKAGGAQ